MIIDNLDHFEFTEEYEGRKRLTLAEKRAIRALARLARTWPRSLTIASMGSTLVVVRTDDDLFQDGCGNERQYNVITSTCEIPNTGGDW